MARRLGAIAAVLFCAVTTLVAIETVACAFFGHWVHQASSSSQEFVISERTIGIPYGVVAFDISYKVYMIMNGSAFPLVQSNAMGLLACDNTIVMVLPNVIGVDAVVKVFTLTSETTLVCRSGVLATKSHPLFHINEGEVGEVYEKVSNS